MFSILYGTYFSFQIHFKMSSAIYFNLDQSNILSSGNEVNLSETSRNVWATTDLSSASAFIFEKYIILSIFWIGPK